MEIVKDREFLSQESGKATFDEALIIWGELEKILDKTEGSAGISAIQMGLPKKVALIKYDGKTYKLLNTTILEKNGEFIFKNEGCLSFPGVFKNTVRCLSIKVQDENLGTFLVDINTDKALPIVFQHEVDHMDGLTIFDRMQKPIKREPKIGRNKPCPCGSGKKYKRCCI